MRLLLLQILCFVPLVWVPYVWSNAELHQVLLILLPPALFLTFVFYDSLKEGTFDLFWHPTLWVPILGALVCLLHFLRNFVTGKTSFEAIGVSVGTPPNLGFLFMKLLTWVAVLCLILNLMNQGMQNEHSSDTKRASSFFQAMSLALITAGTLFSLLVVEQTFGLVFGRTISKGTAAGTFSNSVQAGSFLSALFPVVLLCVFRSDRTVSRTILGVLCGILLLGIYLSFSVIAWGGAALTILLLFSASLFQRWNEGQQSTPNEDSPLSMRRTLLTGLLVLNGFLVLLVFFPEGRDRLASGFKVTGQQKRIRLLRWRDTLRMIGHFPMIGVGPGNFYAERNRFRTAHELQVSGSNNDPSWTPAPLKSSENIYLDLTATWGLLFGLPVLVLLAGYPLYRMVSLLRQTGSWRTVDLRRMGWSLSLIIFLFAGCFSNPFQNPGSLLIFWILFGLLVSDRSSVPDGISWNPNRWQLLLFAFFGGTGLLMLVGGTGSFLISGYHAKKAVRTQSVSPGLLQSSIKLYPYRPRLFERFGDMILKWTPSHPRRAAHQYRTSLRMDPHNYAVMIKLGNSLMQISHGSSNEAKKKRQEALKVYQHARDLHPSLSEAHFRMGIVFLSMNKINKAKSTFQDALKKRPDHKRARLNLIRIHARKENRGALKSHLKKLRESDFQRWRLLMRWPDMKPYLSDPEVRRFFDTE